MTVPGPTKRRPVGGEDRAPACQKRLGESGPAGETGPVLRGLLDPLRFWLHKMGIAVRAERCDSCMLCRQKRMHKKGTFGVSLRPRVVLPQVSQQLHGRLAQMR